MVRVTPISMCLTSCSQRWRGEGRHGGFSRLISVLHLNVLTILGGCTNFVLMVLLDRFFSVIEQFLWNRKHVGKSFPMDVISGDPQGSVFVSLLVIL